MYSVTYLRDANIRFRDKAIKEFKTDIYSLQPSLIEPEVKFKSCLQKTFLKPSSEGDFGKVKFAKFVHDVQSDRWFAIKTSLTAKTGGNKKLKRLFKVALKIGDHPNFMQVHSLVAKANGKMYAILGNIDGVLLSEASVDSVEKAQDILQQLYHALCHLYRLNISPEDCKPGNIFLTSDGTIKLIDFDFWKKVQDTDKLASNLHNIMLEIAEYLNLEYLSQKEIWGTAVTPKIQIPTCCLNL